MNFFITIIIIFIKNYNKILFYFLYKFYKIFFVYFKLNININNMNSFNFSQFEKNFFYLPKIIKKNEINLIKENNVKKFF